MRPDRIVVIGAGIVGVHVAVELARRGAEVILVERGRPGQGTTAGSFAWIDASHPGLAPYLELRLRGLESWRRQSEEHGRPPWLALTGTLMCEAGLAEHVDRLDASGYRPQRLTPGQAQELEPDLLVPPGVETFYHFGGEGWLDATPAIAALLERGQAAGLTVLCQTDVEALSIGRSGRVHGVQLASGRRLGADLVVSCAGRWTEWLASTAGVVVPMVAPTRHTPPSLGLVVRTTPVRATIRRVIRVDGLLIRPDGAGGLLVHSEAHDGRLDGQAVPRGAAEEVVSLAAGWIRGVEGAGVQAARICVRALSADLLPVAGPAVNGLYVVVTHSGVTLAPALGELVAAEVLDGIDSNALAPFRPGRFAT